MIYILIFIKYMKKFLKLLNSKIFEQIKILLLLISFALFLSSCDVCETVEEMDTEEFKFKIHAKSDLYDPLKPSSYWVSSRVFVNKIITQSSNPDDPRTKLKFNVISNDLDMCFNDSVEYNLSVSNNFTSNQYTEVSNGEFITIEPIKEKIIINDCNNPPPKVLVHDVDKCKNGYTKKDESKKFVERAEGKVFEIESYIVSQFEMHNVIAGNVSILPGYKLIIPEEYELKDSGKYSYSKFPIKDSDRTVIEILSRIMPGSNQAQKIENATKKYICEIKVPNQVNGYEINKYCDKFHEFDKINYEIKDGLSTINKSNSQIRMCLSDFENTSLSYSIDSNVVSNTNKISSFISSGCIIEQQIDKGDGIMLDHISYLPQSKFLLGLELILIESAETITNTIALTGGFNLAAIIRNLNKFVSSDNNYKKFSNLFIRNTNINGLKKPQIPINNLIRLDFSSFINESIGNGSGIKLPDRKFHINTFYNTSIDTLFVPHLGSKYNFRIKKSCKAKKIYAYFSSNSDLPNFLPGSINANNVIAYDLIDDSGEYLDEIIMDLNSIPRDGWVYFAIENAEISPNNKNGSIALSTRVPVNKNSKFFSNFLNTILINIDRILFGTNANKDNGVTTLIYKRIVNSSFFQNIINTFLLVFITVYALMIVMGLTQFQSSDLTKTAIKIGFVYALLMPKSWEFFNKNLFNFFISGPDHLLKLLLEAPDKTINQIDFSNQNKDLIFGTVSYVFSKITDFSFFKQVISLLFAGPFGWIAVLIIIISFIWILYASFSAVLVYIISIVLISLFISFAPIFIIFLMFKYTSQIFTAWLKILISSFLTIAFTFVGLFAIGSMIGLLLDDIFSFGICTRCVLEYSIGPFFDLCVMHAALPDEFPELTSYDQLKMTQDLESNTESSSNNFYGIPISINKLFALWILSYLYRKSVDTFSQLASEISDIGFGGPSGIGDIASSTKQNIEYWTQDKSKQEAFNLAKQKNNNAVQIDVNDKSDPSKNPKSRPKI
jgi:type IV secretory pathway VirB6-like protein